jgi:hypothetical protein
MSIDDYSTNPDENTHISGIFIGEQCPPGNVNDAIRQMMADIKGAFEDANTAYLPLVFAAVTDEIESIMPTGATTIAIQAVDSGAVSLPNLTIEVTFPSGGASFELTVGGDPYAIPSADFGKRFKCACSNTGAATTLAVMLAIKH